MDRELTLFGSCSRNSDSKEVQGYVNMYYTQPDKSEWNFT